MMKRFALLVVLAVGACGGPIDWGSGLDFDFDLGRGAVTGKYGAVTFNFVDGCADGDPLFGCADTMPPFAVGSHVRLIAGTTTGDAEDERRLARAKVITFNDTVTAVGRDADGFIVLDTIAVGTTLVQLVDDDDGDVIDEFDVEVEAIWTLEADDGSSPMRLLGAAFPADVRVLGTSGRTLYAHGAVTAESPDGLAFEPDVQTWFYNKSAQVALRGDAPGEARVRFSAGGEYDQATVRVVTRDEITEVRIDDSFSEPNTNKARLSATTYVDGQIVRGGPGCDWRIVSGGGPDVSLSPAVGNGFTQSLFVVYDSALVFGVGETVIECRANDRVVGQYTILFAQ